MEYIIGPSDDTHILTSSECDVEEGDVVVDIGSHIAEFAIYAYNKGASKILTYEPISVLFDIVKNNVANMKNIEAIKVAVGVKDEESIIYFNPPSTPASSRYLKQDHCVAEIIQVVSFSSILKKLKKIDYLKVNCEGDEKYFLPALTDEELMCIKKMGVEWHFHIPNIQEHQEMLQQFLKRIEPLFNVFLTRPFYDNNIGIGVASTNFVAWQR